MPRLVRLDALVGRRVRDRRGRSVGRIEEVRAERTERGWVVVEYHLGPGALVERLSASLLLGRRRGRRVRWDQVDVSDPRHPRLTCEVGDLAAHR